MSFKLLDLNLKGRNAKIFMPSGKIPKKAAIVLDGNILKDTFLNLKDDDSLKDSKILIFLLDTFDRNKEYTPWECKAVIKNTPDFTGGADLFLKELEESIIPYLKENYNIKDFSLVGYSLSGLCSIYASLKINSIERFISLSGSLWFQDFLNYLENNKILNKDAKFLITAGKKEARGRNQILKTSVECAKKAFEIINKSNEAEFFLDEGNHYEFVKERFLKAFKWIENN